MIAGFFRATLASFAGRPALLAELVWGIIAGALIFLAFRKFTNARAVKAWKRKRSGHLLGLYIFGDDPALSLRSLFAIAQANAALLLYALPPLLIAAPFMALIVLNLNEFFASTPLARGGAAVLTVRLNRPCEATLQAPAWLRVDLPPIHIPAIGEISWRIRALSPQAGVVEIGCGGERVAKQIDARPAPRYFAKARERSFLASLLHPAESRLPAGPIERIAVSQSLAGPWEIWFGCIAGLTAWFLGAALGGLQRL